MRILRKYAIRLRNCNLRVVMRNNSCFHRFIGSDRDCALCLQSRAIFLWCCVDLCLRNKHALRKRETQCKHWYICLVRRLAIWYLTGRCIVRKKFFPGLRSEPGTSPVAADKSPPLVCSDSSSSRGLETCARALLRCRTVLRCDQCLVFYQVNYFRPSTWSSSNSFCFFGLGVGMIFPHMADNRLT